MTHQSKAAKKPSNIMRIFLALLVALLVVDIVAGQRRRGNIKGRGAKRNAKNRELKNKEKPKSGRLLRSLKSKLEQFAKDEKERDEHIEERINDAIENMTQTVLAMSQQLMTFTSKDDASQEILNRINEISQGISKLDSFAKQIRKTIDDMKKMEKGQASNHGAHPNVPYPKIEEEPPIVHNPGPIAPGLVYDDDDEDDYGVGSGAEGAVAEQHVQRARMTMGSGSGEVEINLIEDEGSSGSGDLDVEEAGEYEGSSSGQYGNYAYGGSDYFLNLP